MNEELKDKTAGYTFKWRMLRPNNEALLGEVLKVAREIGDQPWRVEKGGRYSVPSSNEAGELRGTIVLLSEEVERLTGENEDLREKLRYSEEVVRKCNSLAEGT